MDSTTSAIKLAEEWGVRLDAMGDGSIAGIKTKVAPSHANATIAEIIVNDLRKRAPSLGLDSVIGEIKRLQPSSHDDDASTKPRLAAAYKDVRLVLNRCSFRFAYWMCGPCHSTCQKVIYQIPDEEYNEKDGVEYVHPISIGDSAAPLEREPAWSAQDRCVVCNEKPRDGANLHPFARGT